MNNLLTKQLKILLIGLQHILYTEGKCCCNYCIHERQSVYKNEKKK